MVFGSSLRAPAAGVAPAARAGGRGSRDPLLDALRSLAVVRIVAWHLFAATWLTWIGAVPVLFAVAGALLVGAQADTGFLIRRLRRMLLPLWAYGACVAAVSVWAAPERMPSGRELLRATTWVLPFIDPVATSWDGGWLSTHLWYLRAYLWVIVLAPVIVGLARRAGTVLATAAAAVMALELARSWSVTGLARGPLRLVVGDLVVYGCFAVLGAWWQQRRVGRPAGADAGGHVGEHAGRGHGALLPPVALAASVAGLATVATCWARRFPLGPDGVNGSYPMILLVGLAWVLGLLGVEPALRRLVDRKGVARLAARMSSRSLTLYLWHPACIVLARRLVPGHGWADAVVLVAVTAALGWVVVVLVGWIEQVAAGRPVAAAGRGRPGAVGGTALASLLIVTVLPTGPVAANLPGTAPLVLSMGIPAPSARQALADDAFAAAVPAWMGPVPAPAAEPGSASPVPSVPAWMVPVPAPAAEPASAPSVPSHPAAEDPVVRDLVVSDPLVSDPSVRDPAVHDPAVHSAPVRLSVLSASAEAGPGATAPVRPAPAMAPVAAPASSVPSVPSSTRASSSARARHVPRTPTTTRPRPSKATATPAPATAPAAPAPAATPAPTASTTTPAPMASTAIAPVPASTTTTAPTASTTTAPVPASTTTTAPTASTTAAPVPASTTTAPPAPTAPGPSGPRLVLNAAALARALVAWRTGVDESVRSVVVSLRSGEQSWTGTADDGSPGARPDPDAMVAAASVTKTFTAALVLRLVDQGRIDLDAPLPSIAGLGLPPTGLTVRRLLTHSGGLVDYADTPGYRADQPLAPAQAVRLSFETPLRSEPGTVVSYANSGYLYLGLLLERLTDRSYGQLVADLAAEVGLSRTRVDPTTRTGWIGYSSGGVVSTPAELARWGQALFTPGVVLSPRALSLLTTIGDLNLGLGAWPSCPCWTDPAGVKRSTAIGHTTANGGLFWFPATGTAMYVRFDPAPEDAVDLMAALARAGR